MADEKWIKDPKDPNEEKPVQAVTSGPSLPDEEYSEVKPTTEDVAAIGAMMANRSGEGGTSGGTTTPNDYTFTQEELDKKFPEAASEEYRQGMLRQRAASERAEQELLAERKRVPAPAAPGNVAGETVDQFSAGKAAANSSAPVVGQQEGAVAQPDNVLTESQMIQQFGINPATGTDEVSTPSTEQGEKVTTPSIHQFKWGEPGVSLETVMAGEGKNVPKRQILDDYLRWSQETGQPIDYFTVNDIMNNSQDLKNTPEDDEKARKKAERKERFDRMGNFLLHLGNAIGNVAGGGYGAVKLEDPVQWTERQRQLKERTDELRRRNNQSIWVQMQKDRADQRAYELKKQQEATNAAYRQALIDATKQKAEDNSKVAGARVAYYNAQTGAIEMKTPEEIKKIQADAQKSIQQGNAAVIKANKPVSSGGRRSGGSGKQNSTTTTTYQRNSDGKVTKSEKTTTYGNSSNSSSGQGTSGNQKRKTKRQL